MRPPTRAASATRRRSPPPRAWRGRSSRSCGPRRDRRGSRRPRRGGCWPGRSCTCPLPTPRGRSSTAPRRPPSSSGSGRCRCPLHLAALDDVADLVLGLAGVEDLVVVEHAAVLHLPVGALDEPELVDAGEAREARDEADVRAFGRLDGADAAVVGRVDVANLEPARSRERPPGPRAESRRLWVISDSGFVWSMNWLSWLRPEELADRRP